MDNDVNTNTIIESNTSEEKKLDELTVLQEQLEKEKGLKLMAIADYHNQKKMYDKQIEELGYYANKAIINQILEIIDDIQRAKEHNTSSQMIENKELEQLNSKLLNIISSQNIEELEVKVGADFEPEYMEALATAPVEKEEDINKIIIIVQKGYRFSNGKILRPARVIVGKK